MPYSPEHKQKSRDKLLASAYELFAHQGYESVTIDQITKHAGMTRGAFYNHFSSKQTLYRDAMTYAAHNNKLIQQLENKENDTDTLISVIKNYLSHEHLTNAQPCPLAFLVTDMANQEPHVRDTYTQIFEGITKKLMPLIGHDKKRQKAQTLATLMIGGVAVSRALNDEKLTNQVMKACQTLAIDLAKEGAVKEQIK